MNKQKFESGMWHHEAVTWKLVYCGSESQQGKKHKQLSRKIRDREGSTAK